MYLNKQTAIKKQHFNDTTLVALQESDDICNGIIPAKIYHSAAELIHEAQEEVNAEDQTDLAV